MKKIQLLLLIFFCQMAFANTNSYQDVVFFGDSLTDDGNLYEVLKIVPKSPPYYEGRFSNGITWAEHLAKYVYDKNESKSKNYAVGGATTIKHKKRTDRFVSPTILENEIKKYFSLNSISNVKKTLFFVWIGANDYLYEHDRKIEKITTKVVNKISSSVVELLESGAPHVVVINIPDLSFTPYAKNHRITNNLSTVSKLHNKKLYQEVVTLNKKYNNKISFIDIETIFYDVNANPEKYNEKYGLNVRDLHNPCWEGSIVGMGVPEANINMIKTSPSLNTAYEVSNSFDLQNKPCDKPDEYLFWDEMHPSAVIHSVLGKIIVEQLQEENII